MTTLFKHILPSTYQERTRSGTTALVFFYFWAAGLYALCVAGFGVYMLVQHDPQASAFRTGLWLVYAILSITGAWQIGRFNRNGIILIAIGLSIGVIGWLFHLPRGKDVTFTLVTVIALIVAWQDLTPRPAA